MDVSTLDWNEDEFFEIDPRFLYEEEFDVQPHDPDAGELFSLNEIIQYCLKPTLLDGAHHASRILLWCLLFKISSSIIKTSDKILDLISVTSGAYLLYLMFSSIWYYMIIASLLGCFILKATNKLFPSVQGQITFFSTLSILVLCELIIPPHDWHSIRGCQMLIAMRIISLSFDCCNKKYELPNLLSLFSYLLCPGTVIFGPWISYQEFRSNLKSSSFSFWWFWRIFCSFGLGMFFLSVSTCWTQYFIPQGSSKWLIAYRDALSFRSSHYFVSYISEASSSLAGVSAFETLNHSVVKPYYVEFPRSLVEVVIYWNIPLHNWFKHYVFKPAQSFGNGIAVIVTYIVSAILHGLNFQLAAVLLSLGFYTYIEHSFRLKLSKIFDACICARPCRKCDHRYTSSQPVVIFVNFSLLLISLFHLTYLGLMFDSQSPGEDSGYSMSHTLSKWKQLGFASHWVALITYTFHCLI